jgi:hypothetical protein
MAQEITHEEAIVPSSVLTEVSDGDELVEELEETEASLGQKVIDIAQRRAETRQSGRLDIIVVLSNWAYEDWSDYDIAGNQFMLVGHVEDYSDKAYKVRGAFEVLSDEIDGKSPEEVSDGYINNQIQVVDETDEDFIDKEGAAYLPKSAVEGLYVIAEE